MRMFQTFIFIFLMPAGHFSMFSDTVKSNKLINIDNNS